MEITTLIWRHWFTACSMFKRNKFPGLINYFMGVLDLLSPGKKARADVRNLQIEITNKCNLSCKHCFRDKDARGLDININDLRKVMNCFKNASTVWLVGNGEPLMHSEIKEIISYFNSINVHLWIFTNLNINSDALIKMLVEKRVYQLHISIDALNKSLSESIRVGGDIELVINNIKKINQLKRKNNTVYPELVLNFVAMKDNIGELDFISDFAIENNFKRICVIKLRDGGKNTLYFKRQELLGSLLEEKAKHIIENAREKLAKKRVDFTLDDGIFSDKRYCMPNTATRGRFLSERNCMIPWTKLSVDLLGDIYPGCCTKFQPFGNISKDNIKDIWSSPKYELLREIAMQMKLRDCLKCAGIFNEKIIQIP